jgi:serine/threonine-protein kinase
MMPAGAGAGTGSEGRWRLPVIGSWRGRNWPLALIAAALVLAAATVLFFTAGPGAKTAVPRVEGRTVLVAEKLLAAAHLNAKVVPAFDENVKPGVVLLVDPLAGREIGRGSTVTLTVSKGPERYDVPQLVGRTQTDAQQRLVEALLSVGPVSTAFSETVPQGQVISTSPAASTPVKRAAPVALVISQGRQPIKLVDWTGQPADKAAAAMTDVKLKVDSTKQDWNDTVPKGYVISQTPATGTLFQGDLVTLVVSKGPQLVPVPNVISEQEQAARAILEGLGFKVKVDRAFGGYFGTVRFQSVLPGATAPKGSTITLTVV